MRLLAEGGYMFEKLVRVYHPGDDLYVPGEGPTEASARTLAAGLFRGFPGGNGDTVTIDVKKLQGNK